MRLIRTALAGLFGIVAATMLAGNIASYVDVATFKHLGMSSKDAALESMKHYHFLINSIGYKMGHKEFYNNPDFEYR
jgi:hypothetical protein